MPQIHFHVDLHDVGYNPDVDAVSTHLTIDGAIDDATTRAEEIIDDLSALPPEDIIRGQEHRQHPVTNEAEIEAIDAQVKAIIAAQGQDWEGPDGIEDYNAMIARKGLLIVIEDGVAVIELVPCSEDVCETYRKDWIE